MLAPMGKKIEDSTTSREEDVLFVRMENYEDDGEICYVWYKLSDVEIEEEESDTLSPCFKITQPDCHYLSAQVSAGPFIFVIGGTDFPQPGRISSARRYRDVYVIDTRNPEEAVWKKGPKLLSPRAGSYAFVLDNTICVIGNQYFYGEVLNLETGDWKLFRTAPVSAPPFHIYAHGILVDKEDEDFKAEFELESESESDLYFSLDPDDICYSFNTSRWKPCTKHLYVHGSNALYSYDFDCGYWSIIKEPVNSSASRGASVDDVLYVLCPEFMGYSMSRGKWFHVSISGFDKYPDVFPPTDNDARGLTPPCLVHLGNGVLCILWTRSASFANLLVHCTKFTVKVEESRYGNLSATAEVKSFNTYKLPPGTMVDCMAVSTSSTITFPFVESLAGEKFLGCKDV